MRKTLSTIAAATLVLTTLIPTAAFAQTNTHSTGLLQQIVKDGKKIITTVQHKTTTMIHNIKATGNPALSGNPTALQVQQGLLNVYATQEVWPKGLQTADLPGTRYFPSGDWLVGAKATPYTDWIGLSTVFPGQPASAYAKLLGMDNAPLNKPIIAATLAQWLMNWQKIARIAPERYYMLKYLPSQDSYVLMKDYNFFWGTDITSPHTVISAHDLTMVERNIVSIDQGYRMLGSNKVQLLVPFGPTAGGYYRGGKTSLPNTLQEFDSITLTFPGNNEVVFHPGVVNAPYQVQGQFLKSRSSGFMYSSNELFVHKNTSILFTMKTGQQINMSNDLAMQDSFMHVMPSYIGSKKPFFFFAPVTIAAMPSYFATFNNGKLAQISVIGCNDPWPTWSSNLYR